MNRPLPPIVQADLSWLEDPDAQFAEPGGETPAAMRLDPAYAYQWEWWARKYPTLRAPETGEERRAWADWWGMIGRQELDYLSIEPELWPASLREQL